MPPFRYTDTTTGKTWISKTKLTPDELDEAFGADEPPISSSADPLSQIKGADIGGKLKRGAPTAIRASAAAGYVGGNIGGAAATAAAELAAEAVEVNLGTRESISPKEIALQTGLAAVFPGAGKTVLGSAIKGAAFGAGSATLDSIVTRGELPPVGQLAVGTLTGGILLGGSSYALRGSVKELLPPAEADIAHGLLTGREVKLESVAAKEQAQEVRQMVEQLRFPFKASEVPEPPPIKSSREIQPELFPPAPRAPLRGFRGEYIRPTSKATEQELPFGESRFLPLGGEPPVEPPPRRLSVHTGSQGKNRLPYQREVDEELRRFDRAAQIIERAKGGGIVRAAGGEPPPASSEYETWGSGQRIKDFAGTPKGPPPPPDTGGPVEPPEVIRYTEGAIPGFARTPKRWFARVQKQTGVPVYSDIYYPVERAAAASEEYYVRHANRLTGIFGKDGGRSKAAVAKRQAYEAWIESPTPSRVEQVLKLSQEDVQKLHQIVDNHKRVFSEAGLDSEKFFTEYLPKIRRAGSVQDAFPIEKPPEVEALMHAFAADEMGALDEDALGIGARIYRALGYTQHLAPEIRRVESGYQLGRYGKNSWPRNIREPIQNYLVQARGTPDVASHQIASAFTAIANRIPGLSKVLRNGEKFSLRDGRRAANSLVSLEYSALIGWRVGPLFRNSMQTLQTSFPVLGKWYFRGLQEAFTKEGYAKALEIGALGAEHEEVSALAAGSRGLRLYQNVDNMNRAVTALGQYYKTLDAARRAKGSMSKFVDYADLDFLAEPEALRIAQLYGSGQTEQAARQAAIALADDTQFMYSARNRPPMLQGTLGKVGGAFGNYSFYYGAYLGSLLKNGSPEKKAIRTARWLAINAAIVGTGGALATGLGFEHPYRSMLSFTFLGPLGFAGGPALEVARDVDRALQGEPAYMKRVLLDARDFVPGSQAVRDIMRFHRTAEDRGVGPAAAELFGIARGGK
jgi:hypothetical protein